MSRSASSSVQIKVEKGSAKSTSVDFSPLANIAVAISDHGELKSVTINGVPKNVFELVGYLHNGSKVMCTAWGALATYAHSYFK